MTDPTLRGAAIQFIVDLLEPVGPFTFSGFGGPIAALRFEIHQAHPPDSFAGVLAAEARVEKIVQAWVDAAPLPALLDVLLDLAATNPPEAIRDAAAWRDELLHLLSLCARRDSPALTAALSARTDLSAAFVTDLHTWLANDDDDLPAT